MLKRILLGVSCLVITLTIPAFFSKADVPATPADGIVMKHSGKKEVTFNHSTHITAECKACHHPVEGKDEYRSCASAGCHELGKAKEGGNLSYNHALHKPKDTKFQTCMACHRATAGSDAQLKKDLTGCAKSKCHP